jgi:MFS family permease
LDLAWAELGRFVVGSFALVFWVGCVAIIIAALWARMDAGWRWLFGLAALTALFFAARRVRTIKRLCDHGVELEAHLLRVWDSQGSETDFRHADYAYEYGGRSYEFTVRGVDFFMSFATRYGERVRVLVDPEQPETSVILGTMYH